VFTPERRPDNAKPKRKKFLGPEADYWDLCKGKLVRIEFQRRDRDPIVVRLDWVDRYTIGVRDITTGQKRMLFKEGIYSIERDIDDGRTTVAE